MKVATWKSATAYHLRQPLFIDQISNLPKWRRPAKGMHSFGIVPLFKKEFAAPLGNSGCWFRLRSSERKISKPEFAMRLQQRLDDAVYLIVEDEELPKKIKDQVTTEMLEETPPTHTECDVMFRGDWFIVCSGTDKTCDSVTRWLRVQLDKHFSIKLAALHGELQSLGRVLFHSDMLAIDNIELEDRVKLKLTDDTVVQIEKMVPSQEVRELFYQTKEVKSLDFKWRGMTARVKEDLTLSAIDDSFDVTNVEYEKDDADEYDDDERKYLESRARAELFAANIPVMIKDIAVHCDGLATIETESQDGMDLS